MTQPTPAPTSPAVPPGPKDERSRGRSALADRVRKRAYSFKQAMYRGQRPGRAARAINRLTAWQHAAGLLAPRRAVTLEVTGRRSGRVISFPVVIADLDGDRYLVAMLGEQANWVRNVRAADGRATIRRRGREAVRLDEVPPAQRAPILRRYLRQAPGARPHIPVDRHAPLADFEQIADRFPVFRIVPDATPTFAAHGAAGALELSAHMTVRPGQLDGFRTQAAECVRLAREQDTRTLRYDWFLTADGHECEVREAYLDARGLVEHRAHVAPALATLFDQYADDHHMTVYGQPAPELRRLAETAHMTEHVTWLTYLDGLAGDPSAPPSSSLGEARRR